MDITCDKCGMEYSLDDTLISGAGTSVRCMNCNQVFKVFKASGRGADEWLLRQAHGPFRTIDNLGLLQQWIQEGKVSPDDLLSQKNGPWKKVGDIEQLKPFFETARNNFAPSEGRPKIEKSQHESTLRKKPRQDLGQDVTERFAALKETPVAEKRGNKTAVPLGAAPAPVSLKRVENEKPTLPPPPVSSDRSTVNAQWEEEITHTFNRPEQAARAMAASGMERTKSADSLPRPQASTDAPDFSSIPVTKDDAVWEGAGKNTAAPEPAWAGKTGGSLPRHEAAMDTMPPERKSSGKWILVITTAVGILAAALFLFLPNKQDDLLSSVGDMVSTPEQTRFQKFFDRGRENFLLDTETSFLQADREFQKVLALKEGHPPTLAALAALYAVWAQYIRDAKLDMTADKPGKGGAGEDKEAALLTKEFEEKRQEAAQWSRQALAADPNLKEALLAAADVARLSGNREEAETKLSLATARGEDAETEYTAALIDIDTGGSPQAAALRLEKAVNGQPMIRALYRIARIQAATGAEHSAKAVLAKLFALNSNHPQAKELAARIEARKKIVLVDTPLSNEALKVMASAENADVTALAETATAPSATKDDDADKMPQGTPATLKRAAALQSNGQPGAAEALYQSVLEREPSNLEALTGIGYCYLDNRESGRALASFRRALQIQSTHGPALIGTAETYKFMGQKGEALKFYRSYVAAVPAGRQADMARKNIARIEAEQETAQEGAAEEPPKPSAQKDDEDDMVIDDSPPSAEPIIEKKAAPPPSEDTPKDEAEDAPPSDKPTIIIMKKDDPAPSEE